MTTALFVFEGTVDVDYGQAWVVGADAQPPAYIGEAFVGQSNGMLGAAVPGFLLLMTSRSSGAVPIRVTIDSGEPPLDDMWEECVEATFTPQGPTVTLQHFWAEQTVVEIPLQPEPYRVRYCGRNMEASWDMHPFEHPTDSYLLSFWRAPPAADRIVRSRTTPGLASHRW
jgi:hypothetical protein